MLRALPWKKQTACSGRLQTLALPAARFLALGALMFLLMRAQLLLRASPLAPALLAAALAAGRNAAAPVVGCLLGMLRFPIASISLLPGISCVLVLAGELALSFRPGWFSRIEAETRTSALSGFAVLLPALFSAKGAPLPSAQALAAACLSAAAAPFLLQALRLNAGRRHLTVQEKTGCLLLACGCIAGLQALLPMAAETLAVLLVLLLPHPAAGIFPGIALAAGGAGLTRTAVLALCSFASGCSLSAKRLHRSAAVLAAALMARPIAGTEAIHPLCALAACLFFLCIPESAAQQLAGIALPRSASPLSPETIAREVAADSCRRLQALGDAFSTMAEICTTPLDVPDEQTLICEMRARLCSGCRGYEDCWAGADNRAVHLLCHLISESLDRVDAPQGMRVLFSDGEIPPDILRACRRGRMIPDRLGLLLRDFAQKRRSEIKRCETGQLMALQFAQARELLYAMAARQESPALLPDERREQLAAALEAAGLPGCSVLALHPGEIHIRRASEGWSREELCRAAEVFARSLGGRYLPRMQDGSLCFLRAPRLSAQAGASCQSGVAGQICGDSHLVRMLDDSRLLLAISDGMGSGEAAADESLETLRLLWRFLDAGIPRQLALETVNRQLLMRSSEEIFATMDLCILDLNTGVAELTKFAACRTLILRGGEIMQIEGGQLPLGILEGVQPGITRIRLRPGDMLVMGSDGVMEAGGLLSVEHFLDQCSEPDPQQLARRLVRQAMLERSQSRSDDLTCICMRIGDARRAG